MKYFGIKTTGYGGQEPYIWWIANSEHAAWVSFFNSPSPYRDLNGYRLCIAEAIEAYESIGYRCVELTVEEKR